MALPWLAQRTYATVSHSSSSLTGWVTYGAIHSTLFCVYHDCLTSGLNKSPWSKVRSQLTSNCLCEHSAAVFSHPLSIIRAAYLTQGKVISCRAILLGSVASSFHYFLQLLADTGIETIKAVTPGHSRDGIYSRSFGAHVASGLADYWMVEFVFRSLLPLCQRHLPDLFPSSRTEPGTLHSPWIHSLPPPPHTITPVKQMERTWKVLRDSGAPARSAWPLLLFDSCRGTRGPGAPVCPWR